MAAKTLTIAGVEFTNLSESSDVNADYSSYDVSFIITNNASAPLTLSGPNKILTIT